MKKIKLITLFTGLLVLLVMAGCGNQDMEAR